MTGEPKTGDRLVELIKSDIQYIFDIFGVEIIAWACDDGPDGKKARRLIFEFLPAIIAIVCWAHQVNLIVGDYLKRSGYLQTINHALDVIKWFNNHSTALDLFRKEQLSTYSEVRLYALSLILPVVTRWTAHYLAITRLLSLGLAMRACCMKYEDQLRVAAGKRSEQTAKAEEILDIVKDADFWTDLVR